MTEKLYRWKVHHPGHGETTVEAVDRYGAVVAAAKRWEERWTVIASECDVEQLGPATRPRCNRCGREFGAPGDPAGVCPDCKQRTELWAKQAKRFKREDRRPGKRRGDDYE